jgi:hypothetical protein
MSTGDPYTTGILLITSRTIDRGGTQRERIIGKKSATHPRPWGMPQWAGDINHVCMWSVSSEKGVRAPAPSSVKMCRNRDIVQAALIGGGQAPIPN